MYTLRRWGEFECAIKPGTPHCGPDDKPLRTFKYNITCQGADSCLDSKGFFVDNMAISQYIDKKYGNPRHPVTVSCEALAKKLALGIVGLIPVISECEWIEATIEPFEGASITFHWTNDEFNNAYAKHQEEEKEIVYG